jgi:hypothetical protein
MCSGRAAALVAAKASAEGDFSAASMEEYRRALWGELDEAELKLHYRLRRLARSRRLVDFVIGRAAARPDVLKWISSMTDERDSFRPKKELTSPLTYLKLVLKK